MSIQPRQVKNKKDENHVPTHKPGTLDRRNIEPLGCRFRSVDAFYRHAGSTIRSAPRRDIWSSDTGHRFGKALLHRVAAVGMLCGAKASRQHTRSAQDKHLLSHIAYHRPCLSIFRQAGGNAWWEQCLGPPYNPARRTAIQRFSLIGALSSAVGVTAISEDPFS